MVEPVERPDDLGESNLYVAEYKNDRPPPDT